MKNISIGIIGFGNIGKKRYYALTKIKNYKNTTVVIGNSVSKIHAVNRDLETYDKDWDTQIKQLKSFSFWEKYFCKSHNVFCFSNDNYEYFFFNIHDMVQYIITNTKWRLLETGRIKGDLFLEDGTSITIFTIEFRNESHKKCFAFGAHGGGKGIQLFLILLRNIKHYHCQL